MANGRVGEGKIICGTRCPTENPTSGHSTHAARHLETPRDVVCGQTTITLAALPSAARFGRKRLCLCPQLGSILPLQRIAREGQSPSVMESKVLRPFADEGVRRQRAVRIAKAPRLAAMSKCPRGRACRWTAGCATSYKIVISATRPTRTPSELRTGRPRCWLRNIGGSVTTVNIHPDCRRTR
jgi:hypothetical protein